MPKEKTPEELQAEVEQQEKEVREKVDTAGDKAKKTAESKGLSDEEVNQRVEAARKEEKDKLYPQLEELKNAVKEMQEAFRAERKDKEKIQKEKEEEAERERLAKLSEEDKRNEALERIEEQLKEERQARLKSEQQYQKEKKESQLKEYRRNAIQAVRDAGEDLLPELVKGNSEEEIDESIQNAKSRYKELAEKFKEDFSENVKKKMPRSTSPGLEALEEEELSEQLNAVDEKKYREDAEYREKIQNELASAYARSSGLQ